MTQTHCRAAIIGLGFVGGGDPESGERIGQQVSGLDGHHRECWSQHPRVRLIAGADLDAGRRERFAKRTGGAVYADWREMLERERPEVVSVATYAGSHAELVVGCVEHGVRAVYCEKPIATRLVDADRMIDAARQRGVLLVVNHNRRFNPNYCRLRDALRSGSLGEPTGVHLRWPAGRLGCTGTHLIDAARMLLGGEVEAVSATLDRTGRPDWRGSDFQDPGGWGVVRFEGGVMMTVHAGDRAAGPAEVVVETTTHRIVTGGDAVTLQPWSGPPATWPSLRHEASGMDRAAAVIVSRLHGDAVEAPDPDEARKTLEVIVAFHVSDARSGAWTPLPLAAADRSREVHSA